MLPIKIYVFDYIRFKNLINIEGTSKIKYKLQNII